MDLLLRWPQMVRQILLVERFRLCLITPDQLAREQSTLVPREEDLQAEPPRMEVPPARTLRVEDLQAEVLQAEVLRVEVLRVEVLRVEVPPMAVPRPVDQAII